MISKAGKDKGRWYVIIGFDLEKERVLVCDGEKRKLEKPKLKNPIHLQFTNYYLREIRDKILSGQRIFNEEIRNAIRRLVGEEEVCK